jgi:hypothetical protein
MAKAGVPMAARPAADAGGPWQGRSVPATADARREVKSAPRRGGHGRGERVPVTVWPWGGQASPSRGGVSAPLAAPDW